MAGAFRTALRDATRLSRVGTVGGRAEYEAVVNAHTLVAHLAAALPRTEKAGQMLGGLLDQASAKVPADRTFTADLFTRGGRLVEVSVDLGQLDPAAHVSMPLVVTIAPAGPVTAPVGATLIDLEPLLARLHAAVQHQAVGVDPF